ncbi:uncharacterized protein LOC120349661 [Nilaparvata lugens]|uniref:uncharacterized protein LOC120349661 n=1 Tax=Nilaparvata lugens TaxID=108931 RepID=UPI00193DE71B|nr:uncharacterized protein LOC120349661 [Nilaparvata lugens]
MFSRSKLSTTNCHRRVLIELTQSNSEDGGSVSDLNLQHGFETKTELHNTWSSIVKKSKKTPVRDHAKNNSTALNDNHGNKCTSYSGEASANDVVSGRSVKTFLRTVEKRKSLFVSRLHPEVCEVDLVSYLKASGIDKSDFECVKLKSRSAIKAFHSVRTLPTRGDVHDHGTRGRLRLDLPYCRLGRTQSSLIYQPAKILNKLPVSARTLPETVLKRRLRAFLQENPFYSMREFYMIVILRLKHAVCNLPPCQCREACS